MSEYLGIVIDYERDNDLDDFAQRLLREKYCREDETSPQEAFARTAVCYSAGDMELAQRIYEYASKRWISFATPVLANAVKEGEEVQAMPISCFLTYVDDSLESLIDHTSEVRWMSVRGGGVGGHWSDIRAVSKKSPGPVPFIHTIDADMEAYHQAGARRGSYAAYLDISHPDIREFIEIRKPTGDAKRKCLSLGFHNAVTVPDSFMCAVADNGDWELKCPNTGEVKETVKARELWELILKTRMETGEPYIMFSDTVNDALPAHLQTQGLRVNGSNLCAEITLPTNEDRSAVCCLSSMNAEKFDEWSKTGAVQDMIRFLDNVLQFFIDYAPDSLSKARYSAMMQRDLGLGLLGYHTALQKMGLPFDSIGAREFNVQIFSHMYEQASESSHKLARERGSCGDAEEQYLCIRNSHLLAVAPNANSAINIGVSASIEPIPANIYVHKTRIGNVTVKNKALEQRLTELGMNTDDVWDSIKDNEGSVQHLEDLSAHDREVFKTFYEIDQREVVKQAADRTVYICQSQSLNLAFPNGVDAEYVNEVHWDAWYKGCKTLYYVRTKADHYAKVSTNQERVALDDSTGVCESCEG